LATNEKWALKFSERSEAQISKLPSDVKSLMLDAILDLEQDPFPPGSISLRGWNDLYRIRLMGYRVIYRLHLRRRTIFIERVKPRNVAYLGLD
jgi:mRNA interferase RelE/StbE